MSLIAAPFVLSVTLFSADVTPRIMNPLDPIDAEPYFVDSA